MRQVQFFLLSIFLLSSCVTTETTQFSKNKSIEKEVEARVQVGIRYLQQGEPEMAIYHMKEIVEKQPKSPRIHEVLALALWETGEVNKANSHFKKMVKYDKEYSRGRMNYSAFLVSQQEYKKALSQLEFVTQDIYYPKRGQAFYMMASVYKELGKNEEMVHAYERSLKLDRRNIPALLELSEYRYQEGQYAQSYELHQRYREAVQKSSAKGLLLGIKLARKFNDKAEEASYSLALKNLYPKSQEYLDYLEMTKNG